MDVPEKLGILTDAAKYDAACTSSGARRGFRQGYIGSTSSSIAGCCHSFSADGRCVYRGWKTVTWEQHKSRVCRAQMP